MPNWFYGWMIGVGLGLLIGIWLSRDSAKQKPIRGGTVGRLFHYLACSLIVSGAPTALLVTFLYGEAKFFPRLLTAVGVVFFDLFIAAICLLVYAVFESKATPEPTV